ncbi:MAG TPA: ferredoxin reductase family protein [Solirubrobacteraceae bacterium]|nr:ferredoxin reductase family protein [Solirubrobacteraceae bacterium]
MHAARPRSLARAGLQAALAVVVLGVGAWMVALWVHGGNLHTHGAGDVLNSIGRITGLLGAYLALLQVLMLARLPWLDGLVGFDRMTIWHRRNGKLCIVLIVAHTLTITAGYTLTDQIGLGSEISNLLGRYPGMVTATVGTGLLLLVVATSLMIVRRRLPYEAWYAVHLLAYAGIALGYLHQIPTGNELTADRTAQTGWHLLYIVPLALVVVFRLLLPLWRAWWHGLRVERVVRESPTVASVYLSGRRLHRLRAQPGQFFIWRFLTRGMWWQSHPFSLSAAPHGRELRITVKASGAYSARLAAIPPGTRAVADGPFGRFTPQARRRDRVALIAGGIGITPIRAMLEDLGGVDVAVVYRALAAEDVVFRDELDRLAAERGLRVHYVIGDHRNGDNAHLLSAGHLAELVPDLGERDVYLCGPPGLVAVIRRTLRDAHVPRRHVHLEEFAFAP